MLEMSMLHNRALYLLTRLGIKYYFISVMMVGALHLIWNWYQVCNMSFTNFLTFFFPLINTFLISIYIVDTVTEMRLLGKQILGLRFRM